jgi:DDE superfamily endonuclease
MPYLPQNLKTMAVAVAFSMAWREDAVEGGDRGCGLLAGFRGSCTGASPSARMRCPSWLMRCCASRTGCTCWLFCHCYARGKGNAQLIPGWPYSFIAALEPGRTSWTLPLDAVRLGPADDATAVTAAQVREVAVRLAEAGHWREGDPDILVLFDAGYDLTRLAWLLRDLPVEVAGRLRSDRVMYFPAVPRPGANGRPRRHGAAFRLADEQSWPVAQVSTGTETSRYGTARAMAWGPLHQQLASRAGWEDHHGELPVVEGTIIRLQVQQLPGDRSPDPLWLWTSRAGTDAAAVNLTWQAFLRRFDIEHTFRFFKQALGWTRPRLRDPAAADRWTWLPIWPARRNPANQVLAARPDQRTATRHSAMTSARPSNEPKPRKPAVSRQVK